jgi:hypothetical protein
VRLFLILFYFSSGKQIVSITKKHRPDSYLSVVGSADDESDEDDVHSENSEAQDDGSAVLNIDDDLSSSEDEDEDVEVEIPQHDEQEEAVVSAVVLNRAKHTRSVSQMTPTVVSASRPPLGKTTRQLQASYRPAAV